MLRFRAAWKAVALVVLLSACSEAAEEAVVASSPSPRPKACRYDEWDETCTYEPWIVDTIRKDLIAFVYDLKTYHRVWKEHRDTLNALWDRTPEIVSYSEAGRVSRVFEIEFTMKEMDALPSLVLDPDPDPLFDSSRSDGYPERLEKSLAYLLNDPWWTVDKWDLFESQIAFFVIRERQSLKAKLLCLRSWTDDDGYIWQTGMSGDRYGGDNCVDYFADEQRELPEAFSERELLKTIYRSLAAIHRENAWLPVAEECYVPILDASHYWCEGEV